MKRIRGMMCAAVLLAACGGDGAREPAAQASADSQAAPAAPAAAPGTGTVAAPPPRSGTSSAQPNAEPVPTAADSAAAAREDVSPEWKLRERSMASYEDCVAQARAAEGPMRARLEAACARLPSAPR